MAACSLFSRRFLLSPAHFHNKQALSSFKNQYTTNVPSPPLMVAIPDIKLFIEKCMVAVGTKLKHGTELAECLVAADYRGHFSHGLNRLDMYVNDIKSGICVSDTEPSIIRETAATAHVDGHNALGPVVGNYSMNIAIKKAQEAGIGWVVAKGSNHYGIAGWYSMQASEAGLLGMSFTNTSPLVMPTRARTPILGTNPITLAAPGKNGDSFVLDMATSAVALGKIELAGVKGQTIPSGWGANKKGHETDDPDEVVRDGGLLPLGGSEITSGYKGYGLGMMVEVFCGLLAGSSYGPYVRRWKTTEREANLGQCFAAINPEAFEPGFADRLQDLINVLRGQDPAEGESEVLIPGDPERKHMKMCDEQGGIGYHLNQIHNMEKLGEELGVKPMPIKN